MSEDWGLEAQPPTPSPRSLSLCFPLIAGALALGLYGLTLAPGLTWAHDGADGGDLLAAALTRGVPHPPGYPLYELLLRAGLGLHLTTDPARTGNWLSALAAAAAVALFTDLIRRCLPGHTYRSSIALLAGLAWAASPALWSQAVITEVYTLHALTLISICWLLWRWREAVGERPADVPGAESGQRYGRYVDRRSGLRKDQIVTAGLWLALGGLVLGLGLANHLSLALVLPGSAVWLWGNRRGLARTPRWALPTALVAALAGLAVYLYLPWAAAGNPPINWGDPRTPGRLAWLVTAGPYRNLVFGVAPRWLPGRLAAWAGQALSQFGFQGAALALLGLWRLDRTDHTWWQCTGLVALAFSLYALAYNTVDSYVYLIPAWAMLALWLAAGLQAAVAWVLDHLTGEAAVVSHGALVLACLSLPALSVLGHWSQMDLSHDRAAYDFTSQTLAAAQPGAVILVASDRPTFALWYVLYGLGQRPDVVPLNVNLYSFPWYRQTLATHHPDLVAGAAADWPELPALLAGIAARRPLYQAEALAVDMPGFVEQPAGALVQLSPD